MQAANYRADWPIHGLIGRTEAINTATPILAGMLRTNQAIAEHGHPEWAIRDATDDDHTKRPTEPPFAQVLVATVPVIIRKDTA